MVCIKCKNKNIIYDRVSNCYFCKKCKTIFGEDEIKDNEEVELNSIWCILIHIAMSVPFINVCIYLISKCIKLKKEHALHIDTRFLATNCIWWILALYTIMCFKGIESYSILNRSRVPISMLGNNNVLNTEWIDNLSSKVITELDNDISNKVSNNMKVVSPVERYHYLDGAMISGSVARQIVNESKDMGLAYLIQTRDIAIRKNENCYRNVNKILSICERNRDGRYFCDIIDTSYPYSFMKSNTNSNEYVQDTIDELFEDRLIYSLDERDTFKIHILRNSNDTIIGFAFQEY